MIDFFLVQRGGSGNEVKRVFSGPDHVGLSAHSKDFRF